MTKLLERLIFPLFILALVAVVPDVAEAQGVCNRNPDHPKCQPAPDPEPEPDPEPDPGNTPSDDYPGPDMTDDDYVDSQAREPKDHPLFPWMHSDVGLAFSFGYDGTGQRLIVLDNYSGTTYTGNLTGTSRNLTHGGWTSLQASLVAPGSDLTTLAHTGAGDPTVISDHFLGDGLQVVNLSFGLFDPAGTDVGDPNYSFGNALWDSLVDEAWNPNGEAIFIKAAGNTNGGAVDGTVRMRLGFRPTNVQDVLNLSLIGAPGALFVGALDGNGTVADPARMASYSTIAGSDTDVQDMFLVAGVESGLTGLSGTSFAAPIVSGYAAIIGDKFHSTLVTKNNSAELVADRLLETARTDTIADFGASCTAYSTVDTSICTRSSVYGMGEADLSRSLAPNLIPQ